MSTIKGKKVVVTGGTRGIGVGIVEALAAQGADITVVARHDATTTVKVRKADITDEGAARTILGEIKPEVLILNAGCDPELGPIHELSWEAFSKPWETDVKGGFFWIRHALKTPLPKGSRVIVMSSGAALRGSPLSGGYAGSKRMLWLMARYANGVSNDLGLGIHFQALVPMQMMDTGIGVAAGTAYAKKRGISREAHFAGFGKPLTARDIGDYVVTMLTDPAHADADVRGLKGDGGLQPLEG